MKLPTSERGQGLIDIVIILAVLIFLYLLAMMFIGGWHCALTWKEMFQWWNNYCGQPIIPLGPVHP